MNIGTNRHDFTFGTNLTGNFPRTERPHPGFDCQIDVKYQMEIKIFNERANYSIDGKLYA